LKGKAMKTKRKTGERAILVAALMLISAHFCSANYIVIDFEQLGSQGMSGYIGQTYSEDGFTLTAPPSDGYGFFTIFPENTIIISGAEIYLTKDDGTPFDLISFDFLAAHSTTLTVTGTNQDNSQVSQVFTFAEETALNTYVLNGFKNLKSAYWDRGGYHGYDNITIVPEPSILVMFTIGSFTILRGRRIRTTFNR